MAPMGKWVWGSTSSGQDGSKELDLEWIHPIFAELRRLQDSRSHYYARGHAHGQMTMTLHIYMPRWFKWTWFRVNPPGGCWVVPPASFWELLSCPRACPWGPDGQNTMMLCIYRPRLFKLTWFGVNPPGVRKFWPDEQMNESMDKRMETNSVVPLFSLCKGGGQKGVRA